VAAGVTKLDAQAAASVVYLLMRLDPDAGGELHDCRAGRRGEDRLSRVRRVARRGVVPGLLLAALQAASAAPARAQAAVPLPESGTPVRLTFPCESRVAGPRVCRLTGTLVRATPQLIEVDAAGVPHVHPIEQLTRLDVAAGTMSHWKPGAVIGFVAGAGVTLMLLSAGGSGGFCDPAADDDSIGWPGCFAIAGAGGIAVGGVGALLGALHRTTRWREVPLRPAS
jgi:hypothetical protein